MNVIFLLCSILIAQLAGMIGAFFTVSSVQGWYQTLVLPAFAPPSWVFGPVWILLYALMGVASFLVWQARSHATARRALWVYGGQLVLNTCWSGIFFGLHYPGWALVEIILLWASIVLTMILFWRVRLSAGVLFIPYLLWVSFAMILNAAIWWLN